MKFILLLIMKKQLSIQMLSKWILFVAIIVFTVTTDTRVNRLFCVVVIVVCGLNMIMKKKIHIRKNVMFFGYFLYTIFLCISAIYAIAPSNKVQGILISCLTTLILVFFFRDNINTKEDVRFFLKAYMIDSVCLIIYLFSFYGLNTFRMIFQSEVSFRIGDDISNSNSIGMALTLGTLIALFFFLTGREKRKLTRLVYLAIAIITSAVALLSGSRKVIALLFFGLTILFVFCGNRTSIRKRVQAVLITLIVIGGLLYLLNNISAFSIINKRTNALLGGLFSDQSYDHSSATRLRFISEGWNAFLEHPIIGEGVYASYNYFGTYAHNNFIEVLMNTGIIGFAIFYVPYIIVSVMFIKTKKDDNMYWILLILFVWYLIGGIGLVTYYSKRSTFIVVLANEWLLIKDANKNPNESTAE